MEAPQGSFGSAIRKARLEKKLTQEKLAELISITPNHVKQLESGRRNPSMRVLNELVYALHISLDSLYSNTNDETQKLKNKINLCLDRCSVNELMIAYATIEALLNTESQPG